MSSPESNNPRLENMSHQVFMQELGRAVAYLKPHLYQAGEEFPEQLLDEIERSLDPFSKDTFKIAAESLLQGIDPEMLQADGGAETILERLYSMPSNLRSAMTIEDPVPDLNPEL